MEFVVMAAILAAVLFAQYLIYAKLGLKNVTYSLFISVPEAFEGDEIEIIEEIDNAKPLPLPWVRTEINCSRWLCFYGQDDKSQRGLVSGVFMLKGYQKCRRSWRVKCEKRGVFGVEDVSLSVGDLLGLAKPAAVFKINASVRVLPQPADMRNGEMSSEAFIGDIAVKRFILPDPFMISGAREYTGREPMNRIHWQQTARTGKLMAYRSEFTTERRVLVVLNMQRNYSSTQQRLGVTTLEAFIKAAAFVFCECDTLSAQCAMRANTVGGLYLAPAEGYEHTIDALRELAELKNGCGAHIDDFFPTIDFEYYTDIVFISAFLSDKTADLLRGLCSAGKSCVIFTTSIEGADCCELRYIPHANIYAEDGE